MTERYEPKSDFLKNFDWETVPLGGHEFGEVNLRRMIKLMDDEDQSNRDWATFLVARSDANSKELTAALLTNTRDKNADIRCEAIVGLAKRDPSTALPIVTSMLMEQTVYVALFEAAGFVADQSLLPILEEIRTWWGEEEIDLDQAIQSCKAGKRNSYYEWPF